MTIRRADASDAVPVARLVQLAYAGYLSRLDRRPAPMDADYDRVLRSTDSWVTQSGDEIVGVIVTVVRPDHLLIENVAVLPTARGHGVGNRLLAVAERHAAARGLREVRLYTNEAMTENLAFYPRHGYRETGRAEQDGFRRVFFGKSLG